MSGAGEGLFAARDLPAGTIAAFYNGVRLPYVLGGPKEDWATSGYKIYVNADFKSGERMNIPVCISRYVTVGEIRKQCYLLIFGWVLFTVYTT